MPRTLLFFEGSTAATGAELFTTDGTPGSTGLVQNIVPGTAGSNPANITATGAGEVVFTAADPVTGQPELFASNGTSAGTGEINGTFVNVANPTTHAIYTVRSLFSDFTPVGNGAVLFVGPTMAPTRSYGPPTERPRARSRSAFSASPTRSAMAANPDVAPAHIDPLAHYITYGAAEGRAIYNV